MGTSNDKAPVPPDRRGFTLARETVAILLWAYLVLKVFLLDVDVLMFERWLPQHRDLLHYKAFVLLGTLAVGWILLRGRFLKTLLYVVSYPAIVLFWYIPRAAYRRWPLLVVFAPGVYQGCKAFRRTFLIYAAAAIAALLSVVASRYWLLVYSVVVLHTFIAVHLWRSIRNGYTASLFADLTFLAQRLFDAIERGTLDGSPTDTSSRAAQPKPEQTPSLLYVLRHGADVVADKTQQFAKSRKFDAYLLVGWSYTLLTTALTYAFAYAALYRLDPASFTAAYPATFWRFLGLSLQVLRIGVIDSGLRPVGVAALISSYSEMAAGLVVMVILGFTLFRAAREGLKDDVDVFAAELRRVGGAVERRLIEVYKMTAIECEFFLLRHGSGEVVNTMRKVRGLSPLPVPTVAPPR